MNKRISMCFLILSALTLTIKSQSREGSANSAGINTKPVFSRLHTLSIHVRDTITHDSVFQFFTDKLDLPVYYLPLKYGSRKYAGVYAGNLVLEPCGPYSDFSYASNQFRAIFFGLTFEPYESIPQSAKGLAERKVEHEAGDDYIYIKDRVLCGQNITISFLDKGLARAEDERVMDSLSSGMKKGTGNGLGIEYVKEICIGYKDNANLKEWTELISPEKFTNKEIWARNNKPEFHFIRSNIMQVQSITFKVRSIKEAKGYLLKNNLSATFSKKKIILDKTQAFGLLISLTE